MAAEGHTAGRLLVRAGVAAAKAPARMLPLAFCYAAPPSPPCLPTPPRRRDGMCEMSSVAAHLKSGGKSAPSQASLLPMLQLADWCQKHTNYEDLSGLAPQRTAHAIVPGRWAFRGRACSPEQRWAPGGWRPSQPLLTLRCSHLPAPADQVQPAAQPVALAVLQGKCRGQPWQRASAARRQGCIALHMLPRASPGPHPPDDVAPGMKRAPRHPLCASFDEPPDCLSNYLPACLYPQNHFREEMDFANSYFGPNYFVAADRAAETLSEGEEQECISFACQVRRGTVCSGGARQHKQATTIHRSLPSSLC